MTKRWIIVAGIAAALVAIAAFGAACKSSKKSTSPTATRAAATATGASRQTPKSIQPSTPQAGAQVQVRLAEYSVTPDLTSAAAGAITFDAKNIGSTNHEFMIIKTTLAPGALPAKSDGTVDETGAGIQVIDRIAEFASGGEESKTVTLEAGKYVLICNLVTQTASGQSVSHYHSGMHAAFEVTP